LNIVRLDRIPQVGQEFAWFHAVAILRQLVDQLIPQADETSVASIPDLAGLSLDASGMLHADADRRITSPPVIALGALLHDLLVGRDQPGALRLLVVQAGASSPTITLAELVYQLGQWERPNRKALLSAVYAMLGNVPAPAVVPSPVTAVSPAEKEIAAQRAGTRRRSRPPSWVAAGAAIGAGLIVVVAILLLARRSGESGSVSDLSAPAPVSVDTASVPARGSAAAADKASTARDKSAGSRSPGPQGRERVVAPASADNRVALPKRAIVSPRPSGPVTSRQTPRMTNAENEFRRAQTLLGNHRYAEAAAGFDRVLQMADGDTVDASQLRWMANEFRTLGQALAEQDAVIAARVYTAADADVVQPVALGQFLPPPPSEPGEDRRCAVQVVIDATGAVESAKLVGLRLGPRDYWWVAVAKAWRFQPATKDGRPVRFLASIPLRDESGLP
jgi:hypothetical protein